MYKVHYTLYTIHYTLYIIHYTLYTIHYTLYIIHYTLYTIHYTLYIIHYTLYTIHYTLHIIHYTLYTIHYTLYIINYTLYIIHYTLYIIYTQKNLFMHKVDLIGKLSPRTTVIISPILPTGVSTLNERARTFNRLLFSTNRWWHTLNFSIFATRNNMLQSHFRYYGNPKDKIHIGFHGIRVLERIIAKEISLVDARSYSVVAKSDIP